MFIGDAVRSELARARALGAGAVLIQMLAAGRAAGTAWALTHMRCTTEPALGDVRRGALMLAIPR